jgi:small neutral amino acid transporter SnatA (MarC family)
MTLVYILVAYLLLAVLDASVLDIADSFVELLGQWGMLVMSFYFGGRTLEKIMDMKSSKQEKEQK